MSPKELYLVDGGTHFDFYDKPNTSGLPSEDRQFPTDTTCNRTRRSPSPRAGCRPFGLQAFLDPPNPAPRAGIRGGRAPWESRSVGERLLDVCREHEHSHQRRHPLAHLVQQNRVGLELILVDVLLGMLSEALHGPVWPASPRSVTAGHHNQVILLLVWLSSVG